MTDHDIDDTLDVVELWLQGRIGANTTELIRKLAAAVRALRDRPCPHIVTSDEGTSYCDLAESANMAWAARWQEQHDRAEQAETMLACPHGIPGRDCNCAPDQPDGTDNPTRELWDIYRAVNDGEMTYDDAVIDFMDVMRRLADPDQSGGTDNPTSDLLPYEPPRDALGMFTTAPFHEPDDNG